MAKNLDKFFKIMLASSPLYTKTRFDNIVQDFMDLKAFRDQFKYLVSTQKVRYLYPLKSSCFRKTLYEDDSHADCLEPVTTLTPLGVCYSFNAWSDNQTYTETEHSRTWVSVINETDVPSEFIICLYKLFKRTLNLTFSRSQKSILLWLEEEVSH